MSTADELRRIADQIRAISERGLAWSDDAPYDRERYEQLRHTAAELFALVDERDVEGIERTLFTQLTHLAPVPCADAAVIDDERRILLIRRADNGLWAMPGGMAEMGETPAQCAAREAREEAGIDVEVRALAGVYDSRFDGSTSPLQLYMFLFLCRPIGEVTPSTPDEVLDVGWFTLDSLPDLSPGHDRRIPDLFAYLDHERALFDRP